MATEPRYASDTLQWLTPLRALALAGVLLNHFVETFGSGPWFTNPDNDWPDLATRVATFYPVQDPWWIGIVRFLGWLGDAGPGVFILLSGTGLVWALRTRHESKLQLAEFFSRRVGRLYPPYVAAHLVLAALALALAVPDVDLGSRRSLLSLLGLRFTDGLFFYINPSWWFVWLILQLYLAFPLLYWLLRRLGPLRFFAVAVAITVAARAYGLAFSDSLYYWMTGKVFLTRLAEFAAGMVLAELILAQPARSLPGWLQDAPRALRTGLPLYLLGLITSFFLPTTVVSNLFTTLGLTALGLALWHVVVGSRIAGPLIWLGSGSYGIYLVHQLPLRWAKELFSAEPLTHLLAAVGALLLTILTGGIIERASVRITDSLSSRARGPRGAALTGTLGVLLLAAVAANGQVPGSAAEPWLILATVALLASAVLVGLVRMMRPVAAADSLAVCGVVAALASIYVFGGGSTVVAIMLGVATALPCLLLVRAKRRLIEGALVGAFFVLCLFVAAELSLRRWYPLESGTWGELPALMSHPTRGYALIPSKTTHLRYNDYDYVIRTNSLGLSSPEISAARPAVDTLRILVLGNAFSMPEGLDSDQGYPALVESRLRSCLAGRDVQVINGGVTGYSPREKLTQTRELVPLLAPDIVIDQFFMTELQWQEQSAGERRRQIGLAREGSRIARAIDSSQVLTWVDRLAANAREFIGGEPAAWKASKALLQYYDRNETGVYTRERLDSLARYYSELKALGAASHFEIVALFVPGALSVQRPDDLEYLSAGVNMHDAARFDLERPWRTASAAASAAGLQLENLHDDLLHSREQPVYFPHSWHWSEAGQRAAAAGIVRILAARGLVSANCHSSDAVQQ